MAGTMCMFAFFHNSETKILKYHHHSVAQLLLRECDAAINYCRDNLDKGTKGEKLVGCYHSSHSEGILLPLLILGSKTPQVDKTILIP